MNFSDHYCPKTEDGYPGIREEVLLLFFVSQQACRPCVCVCALMKKVKQTVATNFFDQAQRGRQASCVLQGGGLWAGCQLDLAKLQGCMRLGIAS
jgi:hypothetical protein